MSTDITLYSYLAGAACFLAFALLLLTRWRGRLLSGRLVLACGVSALWCLAIAWHAHLQNLPLLGLHLIDTVRGAAWLLLLLSALGVETGGNVPRKLKLATHGIWAAALLLGLLSGAGSLGLGSADGAGQAYILAAFVVAMTGLVLVEQLYRNAAPERRWAVKYLCLAVGGLFAFDFYLFATGLMFRQLNADLWSARGAISVMIVPLLAVFAARNPRGSSGLFVSRRLAFYSTSLAAAGTYLLAMAAGGYYIRLYGGNWGAVAQVLFFFGALLILLITMFSGQARARLKVFLSKHFYSYKYDYRHEWLRLIDILFDSGRDDLASRAIWAVAEIVESPSAGLWLLRDQREYQPCAGDLAGPDSPAEPADSPLVRFLEERNWIVDLDEYRDNQDLYGDLVLPDWLLADKRAWLVLPLLHEERLLGILVLARPRAAHKLTWEDLDLLKTVGRQVAGVLAQQEAARQLTETRQFETYNQLAAFIMHDLKNLIAQQSLVVRNAARHKDNPEFVDDAIQTVANSVQRMNRLLEQLRRREGDIAPRRCTLLRICRDVLEASGARQPRPTLEVGDEGIGAIVDQERLALVLGHIVRNAQDAAGPSGEVRLRVLQDEQHALIEVSDNGDGMDETFIRERLFRPFDSTKGSKGMGIGAYQTREFIRAAGGDVEVDSQPGSGTVFRISLPLAAASAPELKRTGVAT